MFRNVSVPILGVVENMSGFVCSHCNDVTPIFGKGGGQKIAAEFNIPFLGAVPIDARVTATGDAGTPVVIQHAESEVANAFLKVAKDLASRLSIQQAKGQGTFQPLSMEWKSP
jgi:ATP-binding protein involved in chromosome partitioning